MRRGVDRARVQADGTHVMQRAKRLLAAITASTGLLLAAPAWAQAPHNWQLSFQPAHSPVQAGVEGLHAMVIWLMALVTIFVALLLLYVIWRYNSRRHPTPSRV